MASSDAPEQNLNNSTFETNTAYNRNNEILKILLAEIQVIEAAVHAFQAQQNVNARRQRKRFWLELLMLIAVVIYASLTLLIWRELVETRKQTDQLVQAVINQSKAAHELATMNQESLNPAKKHLAQEQRPWVLNAETGRPILKPGEKIVWNYSFDNFGKTPALNVLQTGKVLFGKDSLKRVRSNYFGTLGTVENQNRGSVIAPRDPRFRTARSDEVLNPSDIAQITGIDGGIVLFYRIEYLDTAGNDYFTEVCRYTLKNGLIANCGVHNQIK